MVTCHVSGSVLSVSHSSFNPHNKKTGNFLLPILRMRWQKSLETGYLSQVNNGGAGHSLAPSPCFQMLYRSKLSKCFCIFQVGLYNQREIKQLITKTKRWELFNTKKKSKDSKGKFLTLEKSFWSRTKLDCHFQWQLHMSMASLGLCSVLCVLTRQPW